MSESIRVRLERLEGRAREPATACQACGADWPGSVYVAIGPDDARTPRCIRCGGDREHPGGVLKAYPAGLVEGL